MNRHTSISILLLISLFTGSLYWGGSPVWDDHELILVQLKESSLSDIWSASVSGGRVGVGYYRPVSLSIMSLAGSVAFIHVLASLIHVFSVFLVWSIFSPRPSALAAAALFAVHPICSEPLGWASALPDVLALNLGLLSAVFLKEKNTLLALFFLVVGLLSKESALIIPFAYALVLRRNQLPILFIGAVLYGLLRITVGVGAEWNFVEKLSLLPSAMLWPISSLILPWPLTAVRDLLAVPVWVVPLGLFSLALLIYLVKTGGSFAKTGIFMVLLGPFLALPPTLDGYLAAERYAYVSVLGLVFILSDQKWMGKPWLAWGIVLVCLPIHWMRSDAWTSDLKLFGHATEALPESSYSWHFLGYVQLGENQPALAEKSFLKAIETGHPHPMDRQYRLIALVLSNQAEQALKWAASGPKANLTADYMAWWGRAAVLAGEIGLAKKLFQPLKNLDSNGTLLKWDGPAWVGEWAEKSGL